MIVKAPGVVKLLGEHAVVYGRLALAVGIDLYATAKVSRIKSRKLIIDVPDLNAKGRFGYGELKGLYDSYKSRKSIKDYVSGQGVPLNLLPFATIAARLLIEFNVGLLGSKVILKSRIPIQKGLASSAALSTSFSVALIKNSGARISDENIIDVSRDGDRIIHINENAGRIDVGTSFYGGYTSFDLESGAKRENIDAKIRLLIVDTGPKKNTAETVGHVRELYEKDNKGANRILDEIGKCSATGIDALKSNNLKLLGECMYKDHELLRELGVSSEGLDTVVVTSKNLNAYGAKLSGGGGGGIAIVLFRRNKKELISKFKDRGFEVIEAEISTKGAKDFL